MIMLKLIFMSILICATTFIYAQADSLFIPFEGMECMPNQSVSFKMEYVHRESSIPYFTGHEGITSPTGYTTTPLPAGWAPDLEKKENRIIIVILFRI